MSRALLKSSQECFVVLPRSAHPSWQTGPLLRPQHRGCQVRPSLGSTHQLENGVILSSATITTSGESGWGPSDHVYFTPPPGASVEETYTSSCCSYPGSLWPCICGFFVSRGFRSNSLGCMSLSEGDRTTNQLTLSLRLGGWALLQAYHLLPVSHSQVKLIPLVIQVHKCRLLQVSTEMLRGSVLLPGYNLSAAWVDNHHFSPLLQAGMDSDSISPIICRESNQRNNETK